jgi:hypothetical protein
MGFIRQFIQLFIMVPRLFILQFHKKIHTIVIKKLPKFKANQLFMIIIFNLLPLIVIQ